MLREFYRPYFHRGRVDDITLLDRSLQAWVIDYHNHRPNHGDSMAGCTRTRSRSSYAAASAILQPDNQSSDYRDADLSPRPVLRKG